MNLIQAQSGVVTNASFKPANPLSGFDGKAGNGIWTLRILDQAGVDIGIITAWSLTITPVTFTCVPLTPHVTRDLNGDGKADIVWRNLQTGDVAGWLLNGLVLQQGAIIGQGIPLAWEIAGVGDLNGDGKADLVWRNTQTGDVAGWLLNGLVLQQGDIIGQGIALNWDIE